MAGKTWQQECKMAGHTGCVQKSQGLLYWPTSYNKAPLPKHPPNSAAASGRNNCSTHICPLETVWVLTTGASFHALCKHAFEINFRHVYVFSMKLLSSKLYHLPARLPLVCICRSFQPRLHTMHSALLQLKAWRSHCAWCWEPMGWQRRQTITL